MKDSFQLSNISPIRRPLAVAKVFISIFTTLEHQDLGWFLIPITC